MANPTFTIRKKATKIFTIDDYVLSGIMTNVQKEKIEQAIEDRKNILVVGGTGTGKTTLSRILSMFVFMSYFRKLYLICQLVYYGLLNYFHLELFFLF